MSQEQRPTPRIPTWELVGFVAWALFVGVLTLKPVSGWSPRMPSGCVLCGEFGGADIVRNVLMFMPAGVFFARRRVSVIIAVGLGLLLSVGIESAQLFVPGRHAAPRDALVNAAGSGAGVLFYLALSHGLRSASRAVLVLAALLPVLGVALSGWLQQPRQTDDVYYAQWVPRRPYYARWDGALLGAAVGGARTPIGLLPNTEDVRASLVAGGPVELRFRRGSPTASLTAIYVLMDGAQREILMVGAEGDDLVVRPRTRTVEWRLDHPDQRFPGLLAGRLPADTVQLLVRFDALGRACVAAAAETTCAPRAALGSAWGIVLWKGSLPYAARRSLDALTLVLLLLPLSLLAAVQRGWTCALVWAGAVGALLLVGRAVGLAWPGWPELLALAVIAALTAATRDSIQRSISSWGNSGSPE